jgi:hypothetical protein
MHADGYARFDDLYCSGDMPQCGLDGARHS